MLKYPGLRNNLIFTLRALADPVYQQKVWVDSITPREGYIDNFDEAVHCIFDALSLEMHLEAAIDVILQDPREADMVKALVQSLNAALNNVPSNVPDQMFIESDYWPAVVRTAREAYTALTGGQNPNGMFEDLQKGWMINPNSGLVSDTTG
ncbi:MAG TPA: hypothetical protein PKH77_27165 [Anaerolineae bacterium]|nr:hypothetical protein [Anaerolineae bacterium]